MGSIGVALIPTSTFSLRPAFSGCGIARRSLQPLCRVQARPSGMPSRQPARIPGTTSTRIIDEDESTASRIPLFARPVLQLLAVAIHILTAATVLRILEKWTFVDAFYFAVVVATTVGYVSFFITFSVHFLL